MKESRAPSAPVMLHRIPLLIAPGRGWPGTDGGVREMSCQQEVEIYDPPSEGKDYILQIKIKNGPLLRAMRIRGFANAHQFCLKTGMPGTVVGKYLSLKLTPISKTGKWKRSALALAEHLRLPPNFLFPEQHLQHALAKASGEIEISRDEISALIEHNDPEDAEHQERLASTVRKIMGCLTPREERVLRLRCGFNGESKTADDVAQEFGVSKERVRQIEYNAYRKLKHPKNVKELVKVGYAPAEDVLAQERRRLARDAKEYQERSQREKREFVKLNCQPLKHRKILESRLCPNCKIITYWTTEKIFDEFVVVKCSCCLNLFCDNAAA